MTLLTEKLIRDIIMDRGLPDNIVRLNFTFTSDEIATAMGMAARNFNAMPPLDVAKVDPARVPDRADMIEGTIASLYRSGANRLRRNLISHQAGNSVADFTKTQAEAFEKIAAEADARFREYANSQKLHTAINSAFGTLY